VGLIVTDEEATVVMTAEDDEVIVVVVELVVVVNSYNSCNFNIAYVTYIITCIMYYVISLSYTISMSYDMSSFKLKLAVSHNKYYCIVSTMNTWYHCKLYLIMVSNIT